PPLPVEKWSDVYDATVDGPVCPQPSDDPISEDCLVLNVYTTKLPNESGNPKRPVIMYLHSGGFYSVTGRSDWAGPQYFMDQDIVLVTINYRLGSLGFISTGEDAPGNNGLRDQVLAMKWIQNNIESFGGDPGSVSLFGYSAGSWSITLHLVSPMSRGLFHKAIIGSGSTLGHWPLPTNQLELARKQARIVGCPEGSPKEILDCLKTISAEELGNSLPQFAEFGYDPVIIWSPVIEEDFGQERFLPEHPIKLIEDGNFAEIPIVIGVTKDEFANRAFPIVANATLLKELSDNFETYAPICFLYERDTDKSKEVSQAVRTFYLGEEALTNASLPGLTKIFADSVIGFSVNRAANLLSQKSSAPVYYYEFTYQGRYSHFYLPDSNGTIPYGVVHHDDLIYLFYISAIFPFFDETYPEKEM
ncbi:COesterase domain containing protein, partial [Asbolus verrucosus]